MFTQGIRNFNDGISLLNIADGAVEQLSSIVVRLKELAEQAANGTYGVKQRKSLDAEAQALSKEYFRIARSTTFNGRSLLNGDFGELRLQGEFGASGGIQSGLGGAIGTGSAATVTAYTATGVDEAALGDLNGDGIQDMVVAGSGLQVRLGNGDGTFGGVTTYSAGTTFAGLALGDLNNDGILDMVSSNTSGTVYASIRLGQGNGTFANPTSINLGFATFAALRLGDLNNDGNLDLVTASADGGTGIVSMLGNGNSTFQTAVNYGDAGSVAVNDMVLGDMNGDGRLDIITAATGFGTSAVSVRLQTASGGFSNTGYSNSGSAELGVAVGDRDGDGILDVISTSYEGVATTRLGTGTGVLGSGTTASAGGAAVGLADLNGDGISEVSYGTTEVAFGDVNADGVLDVLRGDSATVSVLRTATVSGVSPLLPFSLASRADALQSLSQFNQSLDRLSTQRGIIGAFQSRIAVATNVLQASSENYAAASGRIKDADVAQESANLVRTQILQQAASAVLAQANQQPTLAITLLGNS